MSYFLLSRPLPFRRSVMIIQRGRRVQRQGECSPKKPQLVLPSRVAHISDDLSREVKQAPVCLVAPWCFRFRQFAPIMVIGEKMEERGVAV